jgi:hypothetical protein
MFMYLFFFILLLCISSIYARKPTSIRDQFTTRFYDRCSKYPFVEKYVKSLENLSHQYVIFEYHKNGLRNGGFGDRLGGVITAFVHSLRFQRTFYLSASNGMHNLFRPFHSKYIPNPKDSSDTEPTSPNTLDDIYYWNRFDEWSHFADWKKNNSDYLKNSSKYEFSLEDCVDASMERFTEKQVKKCALDTASAVSSSKVR